MMKDWEEYIKKSLKIRNDGSYIMRVNPIIGFTELEYYKDLF